MKLSLLRRGRPPALSGTVGTARLDRRTRSVVKRVRPGDIAVIDHVDLDRTSAVALVEARVGAVVNVAPYVSGRYPNLGPEVLLEAGVPIVDNVDPEIFTAVDDGDVIRVDGGRIYRDDRVVASGVPHDAESISTALVAAKTGIPEQLGAFSVNAIEHLRQERALLLDGEGVPDTVTVFHDRPVLVVSRAFDYRTDLASLKTFIRENNPVLVGVDAGADALMEAGHRPTVIVTDLDDVSDGALRCGAEVVVHTASGDRANDADRLDRLNVRSTHLRHRRHHRGRRHPARVDARRPADRARGLPRHPSGVPRSRPFRHGELLPHPGRRRLPPGRRPCRRSALPPPRERLARAPARLARSRPGGGRRGDDTGRAGLVHLCR